MVRLHSKEDAKLVAMHAARGLGSWYRFARCHNDNRFMQGGLSLSSMKVSPSSNRKHAALLRSVLK